MNIQAIDKKMRRKARRQARQQGVECPDLIKAQHYANRKFEILASLNLEIDEGTSAAKAAASKAKRKLNDRWDKRISRNVGDYFNPEGKHFAR